MDSIFYILLLFIYSFFLFFFLLLVTFLTWKFKRSSFEIKKEWSAITTILFTVIIFSFSKVLLKGDMPLYLFTLIILFVSLINQFIKKEWDKILLDSFFVKYFIISMLRLETLFLTSLFVQVSIWFTFWIFWIQWFRFNLDDSELSIIFIYYLILLLLTLYLRLRFRIFTVNALIEEPGFIHNIDSEKIELHFLKMLGVNYPISSKTSSKLTLLGFQKRSMFSHIGFFRRYGKELLYIGLPTIFTGLSAARNERIHDTNQNQSIEFTKNAKSKLDRILDKQARLLDSKKEVFSHDKVLVINKQVSDLEANYNRIESWIEDQDGNLIKRFITGPFHVKPDFREKKKYFEQHTRELELILDNLLKEDSLGSNSLALVPYVAPKNVSYELVCASFQVWV